MQKLSNKDDCYFTHSILADLIFILSNIISDDNYKNDLCDEETIKCIRKNDFLKEMLISLNGKGYEMLEFILITEEFNDINAFRCYITSLDDVDFFYTFYGGFIDKELLKKALADEKNLNDMYRQNQWISSSYLALKTLFLNREYFIEQMFKAVQQLNTGKFEKGHKKIISNFYKSDQKLTQDLKDKMPLEVSQLLMGKEFKNRGPYKKYIFVPSCFISKAIRFFNKNQILFYPVSSKKINRDDIILALKAIGDEARFQILDILNENKAMMGKELAEKLKLSTPTVSHHIEQLKAAGFINEERVKNSKYYSINYSNLNKLIDYISEKFKK